MADTCLIYLVWGPLGAAPLERFVASYTQHPAGHDHQLVLLLNGIRDDQLRMRCRSVAEELDGQVVELEGAVLDLDAYRAAAGRLHSETICFLNSYSEILEPGWLHGLASAIARPDAGIAGATGSYESALSSAPRPLKPFLRRRFPPFPNPHLRTNAFILKRELMLSLAWPPSTGKRRALELESGARGITRQLQARGLAALVVGCDGRCFEPEQWPESRTFRSGGQENLLIADNRTHEYAQAAPRRRVQLARMAWGERSATT